MTGPGRRAYNQARALQAARRRYWLGRVEAVSPRGVVLPFRGGRVTRDVERPPDPGKPDGLVTPPLKVGSRMSIADRTVTHLPSGGA